MSDTFKSFTVSVANKAKKLLSNLSDLDEKN